MIAARMIAPRAHPRIAALLVAMSTWLGAISAGAQPGQPVPPPGLTPNPPPVAPAPGAYPYPYPYPYPYLPPQAWTPGPVNPPAEPLKAEPPGSDPLRRGGI